MSCFFVGPEFCSGGFINLGSGSFVAQWEVEPPWCPAGANRKWKVPIRSGQGRGWAAYHIDELDESQAKGHLDLLGHVLHGSDQLVVASEQVSHQPLLVPRAHPWKEDKVRTGSGLGLSFSVGGKEGETETTDDMRTPAVGNLIYTIAEVALH